MNINVRQKQVKLTAIFIVALSTIGVLLLSIFALNQTNSNSPFVLSDIESNRTDLELGVNMNASGGNNNTGVIVTRIIPGSPADESELEIGDVLLSINGQSLNKSNDLSQILTNNYTPGQTVTLRVSQSGKVEHDVTITLGEHYREQARAFIGIGYQPLYHMEKIDNPPSDSTMVIHQQINRVISKEELTQLAPFQVLWPQDIPEGYQLLYIYEMSESPNESSGSGIFVLEYANVNDKGKPLDEQGRLFIWQYDKTALSLPDTSDKVLVGWLTLSDGSKIPYFESEEGDTYRAFLEIEAVNIEFSFRNLSLADVEMMVSTMASD